MFTIVDSICVKLISPSNLLAGLGNGLRLFQLSSSGSTIEKPFALNFDSKVYGICVRQYAEDSYYIVAYGGRQLAILQLSSNEMHLIQELQFHDWISSVLLYEIGASDRFLEFNVLTSHSVSFHVRADNINCTWMTLDRSACSEKSTLYCSRLEGEEWSKTTVFGGTALGELIIWTVESGANDCEVFHRLSGHNGVIFSIDCDLKHNLITTTSDDRSVKIWKTNYLEKEENWKKCTVVSSKAMFGHTARIFQHKIIVYDSQPYIVTIGEDAHICIWTADGTLLFRKALSTEAAQWNLDYSDALKLLFTCGSDGNIHQISLRHILNRNHYDLQELSSAGFKQTGEYFSKIRILSNGVLVGLTNLNKLLFHSKQIKDSWRRFNVDSNENLKCTLLEVQDNLVAVAGFKTATIFEYSENEEHFKIIRRDHFSEGIIRSLKFFGREFLICDDRGNCSLNSIEDVSSQKISFTIPPSKERWITAACKYKDHLLVSDRCGNIHLFEISQETVVLRSTMKHLHGKMGCTSISHQNEYVEELAFETSGHDGTLKTVVINSSTGCLEIWRTKKVPIVWVDKIIRSPRKAEKYLIAGFNDNHFILCNAIGDILFEYECGGGHRFWDIYANFDDSTCSFYYIRNKEIHNVTFRLDSEHFYFDIPKTRWHVRPCNIIRALEISENKTLLISGGDDNLLKFSELTHSEGLKHLSDVVLHVSNIKTISYVKREESNNGYEKVLVFSAGGRAQICVTEIQLSEDKMISYPREVTNFMLNLNDVTRKRLGKSQTIDFDPETRFMSLVAIEREDSSSNDIILIAGCSDGYIRLFSYTNQEIYEVSSHFYGKCILNVYTFVWEGKRILLTMATDGLICFWTLEDFSKSSTPLYELRHHDSGVNSFDFIRKSDGTSFYVATGGDDQSIVVTNMAIDWTIPKVSVIRTASFPNNHTAQVNGVSFSSKEYCLYSISVDQVIFKVDLKDYSIDRAGYSCISDAKGILVVSEKKLLVYGCKIQFMKC